MCKAPIANLPEVTPRASSEGGTDAAGQAFDEDRPHQHGLHGLYMNDHIPGSADVIFDCIRVSSSSACALQYHFCHSSAGMLAPALQAELPATCCMPNAHFAGMWGTSAQGEAAELSSPALQVTWVAMIICILFFEMNLAMALWTGLIVGLAYTGFARAM